jgi:hypothetical protein
VFEIDSFHLMPGSMLGTPPNLSSILKEGVVHPATHGMYIKLLNNTGEKMSTKYILSTLQVKEKFKRKVDY